MRVHIEYPTQEADVQAQLEAAVAQAKPADVAPQGMFKVVIGTLVFIGRLLFYPTHRRFVVERCEREGKPLPVSQMTVPDPSADLERAQQGQALPGQGQAPKQEQRSERKRAKQSEAKRSPAKGQAPKREQRSERKRAKQSEALPAKGKAPKQEQWSERKQAKQSEAKRSK